MEFIVKIVINFHTRRVLTKYVLNIVYGQSVNYNNLSLEIT